jgi:hypothetical protein
MTDAMQMAADGIMLLKIVLLDIHAQTVNAYLKINVRLVIQVIINA